MSFAAVAVGVIGAGVSAYGASQQASAIKSAARKNRRDAKNFSDTQIEKGDELAKTKQDYLEKGDPFSDMGKFIFGDPSMKSYDNLRKAQSDFSALAAGDTSNFSKEVASIVSGSLSSTFGGPKGSFQNLSAKNLFNFRQGGVNTAMQLTNYFGNTGQQLFNNKFGILDQKFNNEMKLREYELGIAAQTRNQEAQVAGTNMVGIGNVLNSASMGISSYNTASSNQDALDAQTAYGNRYLDILEGKKTQQR